MREYVDVRLADLERRLAEVNNARAELVRQSATFASRELVDSLRDRDDTNLGALERTLSERVEAYAKRANERADANRATIEALQQATASLQARMAVLLTLAGLNVTVLLFLGALIIQHLSK